MDDYYDVTSEYDVLMKSIRETALEKKDSVTIPNETAVRICFDLEMLKQIRAVLRKETMRI